MTSPESHCPICEHRETGTVHVVGGRDLLICCACRHVFWREMPTDAQQHAYYEREYTAAHNQLAQQGANTEYYRNHVEELAGLIRRPKEALLFGDVGCSYPIFLVQAAAAGVSLALGVDWSPEAQDYGLRRGVPVMRPDQFTAQVPDGALDLLRYSHTLEHLIDPVATLKAHLLKLAPGGLLYVTQPCIPVLRLGASPAPPHDAAWPNHLHFFSALSMLTLMARVGVEVERFFTVTDETAAQSRYGDALDLDYARATLASLADKGEASRGPLNNFPFFAGQNLAVYARPTQEGTASVGQTASAGERAALIRGIQRDVISGMAELLTRPYTESAEPKAEELSRSALARLPEMRATLQRLEDVGFDALTLAVRADNGLRPQPLTIRTEHPIAFGSADHLHPRGTANDDTRHPRFVAACERRFPSPLRHLDLGCAGGGLVWDFLLAGHHSYGVEGSDFSRVNNRGYWRVVPDQFFTADVTQPFTLLDSEGLPATFDVVTAWEVLEHLPEESLGQFFENVRQAMRPNGLFVASVATFPDEDRASGTVWHVTVRPREWWEGVFARCGLKPTQADFDVLDFVRGSGNLRASDWDVRTNHKLGFHAVLSQTTV